MPLPRVRFKVRCTVVVVAAVAVGLSVHAQLVHWRHLARSYEIKALRLDRSVAMWTRYVAMSHEQWVRDCQAVDEVNRNGGRTWGMERYGPEPDAARRMTAHWDMIAQKYRFAATQPWWPVGPDLPPAKP